MIIDHPPYVNDLKNRQDITDDILNSIAAGCYDLPDGIASRLTKEEKDSLVVKTAQETSTLDATEKQIPPTEFKIYFPNDVATLPETGTDFVGYEDGVTVHENSAGEIKLGLGRTKSENFHAGISNGYPDETNFGLNAVDYQFPSDSLSVIYLGWIDSGFKDALKDYMTQKCPACKVRIHAGTSTDGTTGPNQTLGLARANNIKQWFSDNIFIDDVAGENRFDIVDGVQLLEKEDSDCKKGVGCDRASNQCQDLQCKKIHRVARIDFVYDPIIDEIISTPPPKMPTQQELENLALNDKIISRFFNECDYFEKLGQTDSFIFDTIKRKIRYFHPAFHSTTPEGFNSRLNFLMQCTRQGPTSRPDNPSGRAYLPSNLAFGVAPVCILRIGDLYHTKIIIDNVNYTFDPLVWDLNPEGVGVQPMIVNVDMSFKFIGGSSLAGPINKLQNAVSFNFFGNTEIYDTRADKIEDGKYVNGESPVKIKPKDSEDESLKEGTGGNRDKGEVNQEALAEDIAKTESPESEAEGSGINGYPVIGELQDQRIIGATYNPSTDSITVGIGQGTYSVNGFVINSTFTSPKTVSYVATAMFDQEGLEMLNKPLGSGSATIELKSGGAETDTLAETSHITITFNNVLGSRLADPTDIIQNPNDDIVRFRIKVDLDNGIIIMSDDKYNVQNLAEKRFICTIQNRDCGEFDI
jgi:hypothetical protein